MSNQKYAQVMNLLAAGRLNWQADTIQACLVTDAVFDANDKVLSDVGSSYRSAAITGRMVYGRNFIGDPAFFQNVGAEQAYQVVIVQNLGNEDPVLLGWYDSDLDDAEITVATPGTLVVRPAAVEDDGDNPPPSNTSRVWMTV